MKWKILLILVAEFLLFDRMTSRHYAWIYPRWNDQIQYLTQAYTGYEFARTHGLGPALGQALAQPAAQGELHALWAILVFEAAGGPSRSAALAVNFLAFLAWQAALVLAAAREGRSRALGWMALAFTAGLRWPWSGGPGSATDFRLDHLAMCMMGIALAAALRTDGFRARGRSLVFGLAVGLTLLTRFLTGTYFVLILGACLVWTLGSPERRRRVSNLALAAAAAAALALPAFWHNYRQIYSYYWIGHYVGAESSLRDMHRSLGAGAVQLGAKLGAEQLGPGFWLAVGASALVLTGGAWAARRDLRPAPSTPGERWPGQAAVLGAIFLLAPALVLVLQNQDFGVVLGVAVPGAVVLALALCAALRARLAGRAPAAVAPLSLAAALAALAAGGGYFVVRQAATPSDAEFMAGARRINALADRIFIAARDGGIAEPRVGVDQTIDCFGAPILSVIGYERHHVWVPYRTTVPATIVAISGPALREGLAASDFVLVTEDDSVGPWPYDREMLALRPGILAWCDSDRRLVERFTVFGRRMALYQRREIPFSPVVLRHP